MGSSLKSLFISNTFHFYATKYIVLITSHKLQIMLFQSVVFTNSLIRFLQKKNYLVITVFLLLLIGETSKKYTLAINPVPNSPLESIPPESPKVRLYDRNMYYWTFRNGHLTEQVKLNWDQTTYAMKYQEIINFVSWGFFHHFYQLNTTLCDVHAVKQTYMLF